MRLWARTTARVALPKLVKADGAALCYQCHGVGSTVATDMASVYTTSGASVLEVVSAFGGAANLKQFGVAQLYTRQSATATTLTGPRPALETSIGPMTAGDIDGEGTAEVLSLVQGLLRCPCFSAPPSPGSHRDLVR